MSEERQRQKMTEWASLFLAPGETIRVVTPGTFCDSAAGSPCAGCCDRDNRRRRGSPAHRLSDHPCPMREEEAMNNPAGGTVGPGQVITLARRSAWPREYDMRSGERALGGSDDEQGPVLVTHRPAIGSRRLLPADGAALDDVDERAASPAVNGREGLPATCPGGDDSPTAGGRFDEPDPPALGLGETAASRPPPQPAQGAFP